MSCTRNRDILANIIKTMMTKPAPEVKQFRASGIMLPYSAVKSASIMSLLLRKRRRRANPPTPATVTRLFK